jgi:hypothetical protein
VCATLWWLELEVLLLLGFYMVKLWREIWWLRLAICAAGDWREIWLRDVGS